MFEIICKRSGPLHVKRGKCQLFITVAESVCTDSKAAEAVQKNGAICTHTERKPVH